MLDAEEKREIINNRYSEDEFLKSILAKTVKKIENNPYCRKILEGANYQKFDSTERRPEGFDESGFYLEDIYVGKASTGPGGHCTKEKYQNQKDDELTNGTRDAVYVNEETMKQLIVAIISRPEFSENFTFETTLPENTSEKYIRFPRLASYWQTYLEKNRPEEVEKNINCSLALYNYHKNKAQIEELQNNEEFMDLISDAFINLVTHEASHGNQMNHRNWGAQASFALYFETDEEKEKYELLLINTLESGGYKTQTADEKMQIDLRSAEVIAEACVMANSYIAMLLSTDNPVAIDTVKNLSYEERIDLIKIDPTPNVEIMKEQNNNGLYTEEAKLEQQRVARAIFKGVCEKFGNNQMLLAQQKLGWDKPPLINYNCDECFSDIIASYQEYIFGPIDEYIKAIPEPGLSEERQEQLKKAISNQEKIKQLRNKVKPENNASKNQKRSKSICITQTERDI